jgi:uncharacterized membrane protein
MKSSTLLGIVLIIVGALIFAYQGFTYKKEENVAQIGDLKVTAETRERVYLSPVLGGLAIAGGIVLVVLGRRK